MRQDDASCGTPAKQHLAPAPCRGFLRDPHCMGAPRRFGALVLGLATAMSIGCAAVVEPVDDQCDRNLLSAVHAILAPAVDQIAEVHFNSTGARHYEVVESISVFQADQ